MPKTPDPLPQPSNPVSKADASSSDTPLTSDSVEGTLSTSTGPSETAVRYQSHTQSTTEGDVHHEAIEAYSGAIIHPAIARGWEELVPGAAHKLFEVSIGNMYATEELARKQLELEEQESKRNDRIVEIGRSISERELNLQARGQIFGFILGLIALGGGITLSAFTLPIAGIALIVAGLATLLWANIGTKSNDQALKDDD